MCVCIFWGVCVCKNVVWFSAKTSLLVHDTVAVHFLGDSCLLFFLIFCACNIVQTLLLVCVRDLWISPHNASLEQAQSYSEP